MSAVVATPPGNLYIYTPANTVVQRRTEGKEVIFGD